MTPTDLFSALLRANLVGAAAILVVLILRRPLRRLFGPETAYAVWAAPPLAAFATLLPARTEAGASFAESLEAAVSDIALPLLGAWALGVVVALALLWRAQARFMAAARAGHVEASVVGIIAPRILMPPDDGRYTEAERELIRTHERAHVARRDPRAAAAASLLQALCWFNPLVHVAAHVMRLDQELACDAAVLRRRPRARALYARTLLKAQLAAQSLPFGCRWPARSLHPLEVRVALLRDTRAHDSLLGPAFVALLLIVLAWAGWRVQPPVPPPAPLVELWRTNAGGPTMSVLLLSDADMAESGG